MADVPISSLDEASGLEPDAQLALDQDEGDGLLTYRMPAERLHRYLGDGPVGPDLVLYAQAGLPAAGASHYTANAASWATLPFDGLALYSVVGGDGVFNRTTALTSGAVSTEWAGFHDAAWGEMDRHEALIRVQFNVNGIGTGGGDVPDYWNDTHWATIKANAQVFAAGVKGSKISGIMLDNEHYHTAGPSLFDWVSAGGIDPTHTLAQSQAKARQRGQEFMEGLMAGWPDVRVTMLHGPYISEPKTGVDVWTNQATDPPYWNPVDHANELSAWFTFGMATAAIGTRAKVLDGGEVYAARTLEHSLRVRSWQLDGLPNVAGTIVPDELRGQLYPLEATLGVMDKDEFDSWATHTEAELQALIINAMRAVTVGHHRAHMVWLYTETHDPFPGGMPGNTDESWRPHLPTSYKTAIAAARAAGRS